MEKRNFDKKIHEISSFYEWNGIRCPCLITNITSTGIEMLVKGCLAIGDLINIKVGNENLSATVSRVDGEKIEIHYKDVPQEKLDYMFAFVLEMSNPTA